MKRESPTSEGISNAILAARYLALQQLRERVRRAEERFASAKTVSVLQPMPKSGNPGASKEPELVTG